MLPCRGKRRPPSPAVQRITWNGGREGFCCLALRPPDGGELFQVRRACARKVCLDQDILSLFAHVTAVCVIVLVKREPQSSGLAMHPEVPIVIFQNIVACHHA